MAIVKCGKWKFVDDTPFCVFKNNVGVYPLAHQVLNIEDYSTDVREIPEKKETAEMTDMVRKTFEQLKTVHNTRSMFQKPMLSSADGTSMLLPLDNDIGLDYLTYRDPRWKNFIVGFCEDLRKQGPSEEAAARILLTDYSCNAPYASTMRNDGLMTLKHAEWPEHAVRVYRDCLTKYLRQNFLVSSEESEFIHYAPPRNATKGLGFFKIKPDGSAYDSKLDYFLPKDLDKKGLPIQRNCWAVKNHYPLKQLWLDSGRLFENFEWFLANCGQYVNPNVYAEAIRRSCCSVHEEGYRLNNGDPCLNSFEKGVSNAVSEGLFKKDRVFAFESSPHVFTTGLISDSRYSKALRSVNPGMWGTLLKKRPIYPGPNVTFSTPLIMMCRLLIGPTEDSCCGFPSANTKVMARYQRYFDSVVGYNTTVVTFDRSTAEQFITDNIESILNMLPLFLRDIIEGALCSVIKSCYGPRFIKGLLSGTALTTFLNFITGFFENCCVTSRIAFGDHWADQLDKVVLAVSEEVFEQKDFVDLGDFRFLHNMGTDDQVIYVSAKMDRDKIEGLIKSRVDEKFLEGRSLSLEIGLNQTVFGLVFGADRVDVSKQLGLSKLFLFEKDKLGDQIALKYSARLLLLSEYCDLIEHHFKKNGFGSLESYQRGSENFFLNKSKFGFIGMEGIYNQYSFVDRLIMGDYLAKSGIDPTSFVDRHSYDEMKPFINALKRRFIC